MNQTDTPKASVFPTKTITGFLIALNGFVWGCRVFPCIDPLISLNPKIISIIKIGTITVSVLIFCVIKVTSLVASHKMKIELQNILIQKPLGRRIINRGLTKEDLIK